MQALRWLAEHRVWALGIGVVVLVAAGLAFVWLSVLRSPGTQVDLRQALRLYRQGQDRDRATSALLPRPGVYRYRTSGGEHLSLAGIGRTFPSSSEMVVTDRSCATEQWVPLQQHMEGLVTCPAPGGALRVTEALSYEQIAGTSTSSSFKCPAGTYLIPPHWRVGERWQSTCRSAHLRIPVTGEVLGTTSLQVGRHREPVLHTRLVFSFRGSENGTNPNDYWISLQDGLIVRQRETVDITQPAGPLGSVRYTEQMGIMLLSAVPVR